eukprot:XP_024457529.1 probable cadmium/zinc-transporting ATPase HMA1, chloroplastic isoform X2 [Populus trichocarpa]
MTFHFSYEMAIFILFILIYQVMLVMEVLSSKRKLQRCLDEFGEHYSKLVVGLAVANALLEPFLFEWPFMITPVCKGSVYRAQDLMVAASHCALAVAPLAYATAINSCARKEGVWSWWEGINYAPALAAATVGIVLAQRATATAIAVACVLTAKGCHTWCSILYFIKSRQRTSLFEQNAALALTSIFLAFLPSILNFLPLWSTVLHLSSSHMPRFYMRSE